MKEKSLVFMREQEIWILKICKDFGDAYVFPGTIDVHVHCFSNPNEGFVTTSSSAAAGGITTFLDMPYDLPNPINNVEQFKKKVKQLEEEAIVDICLWGTISKRVEQIKLSL